ncbi:MAG: leucyl aminopeptidase [Fusobacteriaceae bacterium]
MNFNSISEMKKKYSLYVTAFFEGKVENFCGDVSDEAKLLLEKLVKEQNFTGKKDQVFKASYLNDSNEIVNVMYIGAGKEENFCREDYRDNLYKALANYDKDVCFYSPEKTLNDLELVAEVTNNISYSFDKYREEKDKKAKIQMDFFSQEKIDDTEIKNILSSLDLAKDLINEQANIITPKALAEAAKKFGEEFGFDVEILDEAQAEKFGMHAFLSVGRASINRPYFIVARYFGNKSDKFVHGLVGKGITYDTGGLSLKPADSMIDMKDDMSGAATVLATISALAKNKVKKNVVAVVAACENSIGHNAYRPGDIVGSMNGKYIEVLNTDAEGRLTLADAVTYITRVEKVSEIIDVATLTGAIRIALGTAATGAFTNNKEMFLKLDSASKKWNENFWQMPIYKEYHKQIKSDIASVKNTGGRNAGSCSAAAFIESFVENNMPWMHLDIAATALMESDSGFHKKGATGVAIKSLYTYIKN